MPTPLPPTPKTPRPLPHKPKEPRPLTEKLMARISRIIEKSNGKHTRQTLANAIGKGRNDVAEYLLGFRAAPSSETTLKMLEWANRHDPRKK